MSHKYAIGKSAQDEMTDDQYAELLKHWNFAGIISGVVDVFTSSETALIEAYQEAKTANLGRVTEYIGTETDYLAKKRNVWGTHFSDYWFESIKSVLGRLVSSHPTSEGYVVLGRTFKYSDWS